MYNLNTTIDLYMDDCIIDLLFRESCKDNFLDAFRFSESYFEYLKRSMVSLEFEDYSIQNFFNDWKEYRRTLQEFFSTKDVIDAVKLKNKIKHLCTDLSDREHQIKKAFIGNWNFHLTGLQEGEYADFAIVVQALNLDDFRNPGRGKVIASSLYTNKLQKLYYNRCLGFVYDFSGRDILLASTSDAGSNFSSLDGFEPNVSHYSMAIGNIFGRAWLQNQAFFKFKEFESKCSPENLNEIIFNRSSWENQIPSGVFIKDGISEKERHFAFLTAELRKIFICECKDGILKVYRV